ncbi:hypothetical protein BGP_2958 [Beggiatoa sp. PS]|nr:hypothetical protein BGP_2958 [Beggiatoa sp. PS]
MKELLQKFRELINSEFHYSNDKGNTITLFETEESSKCQYVKLRKGNIKTFTLQLDQKNNLEIHPLLAPIEKLKVKCDYILFCLKKNTVYVLLIEMKSDNATGWTKQTRAGEIIARYLIGMVENFSGLTILPYVEFRHILFSTQVRNKHNTAEKIFQYEQDHKFGFRFTRKPCNTDYPDLGTFLR